MLLYVTESIDTFFQQKLKRFLIKKFFYLAIIDNISKLIVEYVDTLGFIEILFQYFIDLKGELYDK